MKKYRSLFVILFSLTFCQCGAIAEAIDAITSADCDSYILEEVDDALSELCRDLEDYLDTDTSSLLDLAQAIPTDALATDGLAFLQLTDDAGAALDLDLADITSVAISTDEGVTYTEIGADSVERLSETDTMQTSLLMVLDYSGSILDDDLADVNAGLDVFFDVLTVGYQGAVIKFSTDVDLVQDFTEDEDGLLVTINDTSYARQLTSLNDAIYTAVDDIKDETTPLKLVILFTDGVDNDSEHTQDEAIAHAQENKIPICVVGVGFANVSTLETIAEETGCFFVYKTVFTSLDDAFNTFADQINNLEVLDLPDDFDATSGLLKVTVATAAGAQEILQSF